MTLALPVFLCLSQAATAGDAGRMLVASNPLTGIRVEYQVLKVDRITIRFFHSYDRHWVEESFKIAGDRFVPVEVSYADDTYDYRGQRYRCNTVVEKKHVRLTAIQPRPGDCLSRIATRVAHTYPQQLLLHGAGGDRSIPFTQWGRPGQLLVFTIE
jgi:hypothetical protein